MRTTLLLTGLTIASTPSPVVRADSAPEVVSLPSVCALVPAASAEAVIGGSARPVSLPSSGTHLRLVGATTVSGRDASCRWVRGRRTLVASVAVPTPAAETSADDAAASLVRRLRDDLTGRARTVLIVDVTAVGATGFRATVPEPAPERRLVVQQGAFVIDVRMTAATRSTLAEHDALDRIAKPLLASLARPRAVTTQATPSTGPAPTDGSRRSTGVLIGAVELQFEDPMPGGQAIWIENRTEKEVDVSCWSLLAVSTNQRAVVLKGTRIAPQRLLRLATPHGMLGSVETIVLSDAAGVEIDRTPQLRDDHVDDRLWFRDSTGWQFGRTSFAGRMTDGRFVSSPTASGC